MLGRDKAQTLVELGVLWYANVTRFDLGGQRGVLGCCALYCSALYPYSASSRAKKIGNSRMTPSSEEQSLNLSFWYML